MNFKKVLATTAALTLVATAAAGCGKSGETKTNGDGSSASAKQEIKLNYRAEPPVLDVSKATAAATFTFIGAVNEGLYRQDKDLKATPGLAKELPKISSDGLTYTVTLRDGITWEDGTPITAKDFVYSYLRTLDPQTKAEYAFFLEWIKGGKELHAAKTPDEFEAKKKDFGVVAKDDKTLEITLVKPIAFFTDLLAFQTFYPQKKDFVEKQGEKYGVDADKIIASGPFKLQSWTHDQSLVLVKNEKYWDAANVKLDKVTVNIVKDPDTGVNLYESNNADFTDLRGDTVAQYKSKPDFKVKNELVTTYLQYQTKKYPAFANAKIRTALGLAIDRKNLVDTVLKDASVPSTGFVPVGTLDGNGKEFRKTAGDIQPNYDPAKAKQLLAEGLKELNLDKLPKFTFLADDTDGAKKSLEYIIGQWKQNLGVEAEAQPVPHKLRLERQTGKQFEAVLMLWGADYNDPTTFTDLQKTDSDFNYGEWSNAAYDKLVADADKETDNAKRAKLLADAEKVLIDDAGVVPLYFRSQTFAVRPNIQGLILPPYGVDFELKWTSVK